MHHARKRETGKCPELQHLHGKDKTGSRGLYAKKRDAPKGLCRKSNAPDVIVIEDDDGDGEVENYDNVSFFRNRHRHLSSGSGLGDRESSFNTYELSTSTSDEEDCVVIEPFSSIQVPLAKHRFSRARKKPRLSADKRNEVSRRRSSSSDLSESEIVPDLDGKVKQDWEEAALRRRTEKSRKAESEESTSTSVHGNDDVQKVSKGHDDNTLQIQMQSTWKQALGADSSSCLRKKKEDVAFDQQGSNADVCDVFFEASADQILLPQSISMSAKQGPNVNSKSLKLGETGAGVKLSGRLDDTGSYFKADKQVKKNEAVVTPDKVLTDREALKQTEEFRHANEEEWARRHLELQKQAEKAQREKKKRKLKADRQIEMEARQKRRLEEIRQSQLKEEQATGLKERVRDRVLSELGHIVSSCRDMATLLRKLGVPVEGGAFATDQQVNAAYKKALLRFHPDRAAALAKSDPASQVEAEEKFKLVSRMKSVLPLVSSGFYR